MNSTQKHQSSPPVQDMRKANPDARQGLKPVRRLSGMPERQMPKIVRYKGPMDRVFLILVLILICFGSVMVFSASYAYSMSRYNGNGYVYISKQLINVLIGLGFMFGIAKLVDPYTLRKNVGKLYFVTIILLALVLLIGTIGGGAKRWIMIAGFSVQPSEIAKATLVFMLAAHFEKHSERIISPKSTKESLKYGLLWPLMYTGILCLLVVLEKHLSGTIIIFLIGIAVMWAGGTDAKFILIPGLVCGSLLTVLALLIPYTKRRIDIWLNPTNDLTGDGWQTIQGLNAIGSGGLLGLGPTNSRQKHMYVSQPQNDFIYSILCEELGFIGAVTVIVLFVMLIVRGYHIAKHAPDTFSSLVVIGIVSKIGLQAAFNIGVVTNLIPNTGISLPFFSYGGSSTIVLLAEMGVVLSISRFSRQDR
ncbi:MAG: FtsW/RodA/SpoVE family cell cycle protein [Clostridia bacterium]|nr:FtsW/RodA/SpoVE family cell cycle protein [Clostridia bacterium]